jgi:hypothetical protein
VIAFRWRRKRDGEPVARVCVTWKLTHDDMADLLCAHLNDIPGENDGELSRAQVEKLVRDQLAAYAEARYFWYDRREEYPGETTNDEFFAWAQKQAAKL